MGASTIKPSARYAWEAEGFLCLQWLLITNHALLHYFLSIDNIDALRQVFCLFVFAFLLQMSTILWSWKQETIFQQKWAIISPPAPPSAHLHFANAWKRAMCLICIYSTIYIALSAHKSPQISLKNRLIQQLIRLKIWSKNLKNSSSIDNILCFHPKKITRRKRQKSAKNGDFIADLGIKHRPNLPAATHSAPPPNFLLWSEKFSYKTILILL